MGVEQKIRVTSSVLPTWARRTEEVSMRCCSGRPSSIAFQKPSALVALAERVGVGGSPGDPFLTWDTLPCPGIPSHHPWAYTVTIAKRKGCLVGHEAAHRERSGIGQFESAGGGEIDNKFKLVEQWGSVRFTNTGCSVEIVDRRPTEKIKRVPKPPTSICASRTSCWSTTHWFSSAPHLPRELRKAGSPIKFSISRLRLTPAGPT